ncbi:MAG: PD40 domain-containing protein [Flavobacteriales bacterium]|nr:PD40 domain-containing protein [Flavobacteriales bacterium]
MKFYKLFFYFLLVLLSFPVPLRSSASDGDNDKKLAKDAEVYYKQGNYHAALRIYLNLERRAPESIDYKFKIGVCYLYESRDKHKSIEYLEEVKLLDPKTKDIEFYLGRAYHKTYNFKKAVKQFNLVLDSGKPSDNIRKETEHHLNYCRNAKLLVQFPLDVNIQNMGRPINTSGSEYVPVISVDQSMMIYTYKGEKSIGGRRDEYGNPDAKGTYSEDIYLSYKVGDSWLEPEKNKMFYATVLSTKIQEGINSSGHDASIALSIDGQKLFVYKDTEVGSGDIYVSERDGDAWTYPVRLNLNINSDHWEGSASLSADEQTLFFSSERPGGLGGKDIYMSVMREDGVWDEAVNLGPNINTEEDDDAPFIHPDNRTLYFSSKGHKSMGGYDIFSATLDEKGKWGKPLNIGYPINTTADDIYYVVTGDGNTAYFSSSRIGGYGNHDIYMVQLGSVPKPNPIVLLKGKILTNDEYTEAKITCTYGPDQRKLGPFTSNSATGAYIISLPVGFEYLVTYEATGFNAKSKKINTVGVKKFKEINNDVNFYNADFNPQLTMDGRLLYSENPTRPAGLITVRVENESGTFSRKVETNQKGEFRFINLPPDQHYVFLVEQKDPDLIPGSDPLLYGTIKQGGIGQSGVVINNGTTDDSGEFKFGKGLSPISKYETLPKHIPTLDSLYLVNPELYQEIMKRYGSKKSDELVFRVQIAALAKPENFDYSTFNDLGEVELLKLDDSLTRFLIGKYQTLAEAEAIRDKIIQRDVGDAFTLIFYNGERKYLKDAVTENLF